jgi:hypothetical protein
MRFRILLPLALGPIAFAQQPGSTRIGKIEFYGTHGIDAAAVRRALPIHEGDSMPAFDEPSLNRFGTGIKQAVEKVTGHPPTNVNPNCCDEHGDWIIYIGLPGVSGEAIHYNAVPAGAEKLPAPLVASYHQVMDALLPAIQRGAGGEDQSKGYALSVDQGVREKQLEFRKLAIADESQVYAVLEKSASDEQRAIAAHAVGYLDASNRQIEALLRATHDHSAEARNNAVRALGVIANSGRKVPATPFIELLKSGVWTDRNKGLFVLDPLTRTRDPQMLEAIRRSALDDLIEMARWRYAGHSESARLILGRIAKIDEAQLKKMIDAGKVEEIIAAAQGHPVK